MEDLVTINVKPLAIKLENDSALHNLATKQTDPAPFNFYKKIRTLKDTTTSVFTDTFFKNYINPQGDDIVKQAHNTRRRNIFLVYVYDTFKFKIHAEFNLFLMEKGHNILSNKDEYVDFIFKGGNILFTIYNILNTSYPQLGQHLQATPAFLAFIEDNFKISDFDFAMFIKTNCYKKYIIIKKLLTQFLITKLDSINLFFNDLLFRATDMTNQIIINAPVPPNIDIPNPIPSPIEDRQSNSPQEILNIELLLDIESILSRLYNNDYFHILIKLVLKHKPAFFDALPALPPIQDLLLFIQSINKYTNHYQNNIIFATNIIYILFDIITVNNFLETIEINHPNPSICTIKNLLNIYNICEYINKKYMPLKIFNINPKRAYFEAHEIRFYDYFKKLENYITTIKFYNMYDIDFFLNELRSKLYDLMITQPVRNIFIKQPVSDDFLININHPMIPSNDTTLDCFNYFSLPDLQNINSNNILLESTKNVFVCDDVTYDKSDIVLLEQNTTTNYHYYTYNSSINVSSNQSMCVVNFDLLRSKLNIVLKNVQMNKPTKIIPTIETIKIPSEFIDISISCYEDSGNTFTDHIGNKSMYRINLYNGIDANTNFYIEGYSISYIIKDLVNMLFNQPPKSPWSDLKYKKRLYRLFFLYRVESINNFQYMDTLETISNHMNQDITNGGNGIIASLPYLLYDTATYIQDYTTLITYMNNNHLTISEFKFGKINCYLGGIDKVTNILFYVFILYKLYDHGNIGDPINVLLLNYHNYIRKIYNLVDYTPEQFRDLYVAKIPLFIQDFHESLNTISTYLDGLNLIFN